MNFDETEEKRIIGEVRKLGIERNGRDITSEDLERIGISKEYYFSHMLPFVFTEHAIYKILTEENDWNGK